MRQDSRRWKDDDSSDDEEPIGRIDGKTQLQRVLPKKSRPKTTQQQDRADGLSDAMKANWPTRKEAEVSADPKQQTRVHIRWMIRRDMPEVLDIEGESFEFPWFEEDFIRCLRQRNCIGMVAEQGDRVVGFMIYELHKTRLHILNFAVSESARMRGVGRQMAEKLVSKLSGQRRTRITLEVRETNLGAQLFFKQVGFVATTVLRAYYEDSPEDAYVMQFEYPEIESRTVVPHNRLNRYAG